MSINLLHALENLYYKFAEDFNSPLKQIQWHVGDPIPETAINAMNKYNDDMKAWISEFEDRIYNDDELDKAIDKFQKQYEPLLYIINENIPKDSNLMRSMHDYLKTVKEFTGFTTINIPAIIELFDLRTKECYLNHLSNHAIDHKETEPLNAEQEELYQEMIKSINWLQYIENSEKDLQYLKKINDKILASIDAYVNSLTGMYFRVLEVNQFKFCFEINITDELKNRFPQLFIQESEPEPKPNQQTFNSIFPLIDRLQILWEKSAESIKENAEAQKLIADTSFAQYQKTENKEQNDLVTNDVIIKHDYDNMEKIQYLIEQEKENETLKKSLETFCLAYQKIYKIHDFIEDNFVGTLESWYRIRKIVEYLYSNTMNILNDKLPINYIYDDDGNMHVANDITIEQFGALYGLNKINLYFSSYIDLNSYLHRDFSNFELKDDIDKKKAAYFDRDIDNYKKIYLDQCKYAISVLADNPAQTSAVEHLTEVQKLFNSYNSLFSRINNNKQEATEIETPVEIKDVKFLIELLNNKYQNDNNTANYFGYVDFKMTNNDLTLDEKGNIDFCFDADCMKQNITQALKAFKGEYDFNINLGIEYKKILGEYPDIIFLINQIKKQLNGIKNILYTKIELKSVEKRIVEANIKCQTPFGEVNVGTN